jgi:membrane protein YqaA with SNARE-associated domain
MVVLLVFLAGLSLGAVIAWALGREAGRREGRLRAFEGPRQQEWTREPAAVRFKPLPYDREAALDELGRQMVRRV